jgi:membrane protein YqaA with SNARE-associated domain
VAGALLVYDNVWIVILVAAAGNTLGGMISFMLGWLCTWDWLEKYLNPTSSLKIFFEIFQFVNG